MTMGGHVQGDDTATLATLGQRIRALRVELRLRQDELGTAVGLTRSSIANIEAGRQRVRVDTLGKIAEVFHVPLSALLGESNVPLLPRVRLATTCAVHCQQCGIVASDLSPSDAIVARSRHVRSHLGGVDA
jgi:transcriptional regulator with XRE-family HTH domain